VGVSVYRAFANELKTVRNYYNLSFKEIAEIAGVSPSYLKRLEDGEIKKPPHEKLGKIAYSIFKLVNEDGELPEDFNYQTIKEMYNWNLDHGGLKVEGENRDAYFLDEDDEDITIKALVGTMELISEFYKERYDFKEPIRQIILKEIIHKDPVFDYTVTKADVEVIKLFRIVKTYHLLNPGNREILYEFCRILTKCQMKQSK
jgi:transcriptional regulator with XRE-family HTH domain